MKLRENTSIVVVVTLEVVTADKKSVRRKKNLLADRQYTSHRLQNSALIEYTRIDQEYRHSWPDIATFLPMSLLLPPRDDSTQQPPLSLLSFIPRFFCFPFPFSLFFPVLSSLSFPFFPLLPLFPFSLSFFSFLSFLFLFFFYFLSLSLSFFPPPSLLFSRWQRNLTYNILTR